MNLSIYSSNFISRYKCKKILYSVIPRFKRQHIRNCQSSAKPVPKSRIKITDQKIDLTKYPPSHIRNFCIIAHVDHGKSTLSDRLMEFAGNLSKDEKHEQVLDKLQVEKERGITVKAQTVSLFYEYKGEKYLLNLIDTPGHVDFSHEVNRSLNACQGVLLLVDANQGVQAQTVANFNLAYGSEVKIIPVLNKIDLKNAKPDAVCLQMNTLFGFAKDEILKVSAKFGTGIEELVHEIIEKMPPPEGNPEKTFRALLYDSWYSHFRGVILMITVIDGSVKTGDIISSFSSDKSYEIKELGILYPQEIPVLKMSTGHTGYVVANIRESKDVKVGDTWFLKDTNVEAMPLIATSKPMVFAGIYPCDQSQLQDLRKAIEKLTLNDSSVSIDIESSAALGHGWRLGFLGLLHMEVFSQRLDQEFDAQVVLTTPGVPYKVKIQGEKNIKTYGGEEIIITNPIKFPDSTIIVESFEPMVLGTIITPLEYYGNIMKLCMNRRGIQKNSQNIDDETIMLIYKFPMSEIVVNFFDELKSLSSGFASFDYEEIGYESSLLTKMNVMLNGKVVEELTLICHQTQVQQVGRAICLQLKENIHQQQFLIAIQAAVGGKVVARETIKALRKDVTAKLYGGDPRRKMKLLQRQSEGKRKMRMVGNVEVPRDAFIKILKR